MITYSKSRFENSAIELDNKTFEGCVFKNCTLIYGGGALSFNNNNLDGVEWRFIGPAARTLGLISAFYQGGGESKRFVEILLSVFGKEDKGSEPVKEESTNE